MTRALHHETHLPTVCHQAQAHSRLSGEDEDPRGPRCDPRPASQRTQAPGGLSRPLQFAAASVPRRKQSSGATLRLLARHAPFALFALSAAGAAKPGPGTEAQNRIVLGLPKKLLRRAVDRNRIRRLARESFGAFVRNGRIEPSLGPVVWLARLERSPQLASFEALSLRPRKRHYRQAFDALLDQARQRLGRGRIGKECA